MPSLLFLNGKRFVIETKTLNFLELYFVLYKVTAQHNLFCSPHTSANFRVIHVSVTTELRVLCSGEREVRWSQGWFVRLVVENSESKAVNPSTLSSVLSCETWHCRVGGKPGACQDQLLECVPLVFAELHRSAQCYCWPQQAYIPNALHWFLNAVTQTASHVIL